MKKFLMIVLAMIMVFALVACGAEANKEEPTKGAVADLEVSEISEPIYIVQLDFEDGENVESAFYKRTANDNGDSMYMVKNTDGESVYMPVTDTVVYTSNEPECYYQEIKLAYKVDGVPMEKTQYQIYITNSTNNTNDTVQVVPGNEEGADLMNKENKMIVM